MIYGAYGYPGIDRARGGARGTGRCWPGATGRRPRPGARAGLSVARVRRGQTRPLGREAGRSLRGPVHPHEQGHGPGLPRRGRALSRHHGEIAVFEPSSDAMQRRSSAARPPARRRIRRRPHGLPRGQTAREDAGCERAWLAFYSRGGGTSRGTLKTMPKARDGAAPFARTAAHARATSVGRAGDPFPSGTRSAMTTPGATSPRPIARPASPTSASFRAPVARCGACAPAPLLSAAKLRLVQRSRKNSPTATRASDEQRARSTVELWDASPRSRRRGHHDHDVAEGYTFTADLRGRGERVLASTCRRTDTGPASDLLSSMKWGAEASSESDTQLVERRPLRPSKLSRRIRRPKRPSLHRTCRRLRSGSMIDFRMRVHERRCLIPPAAPPLSGGSRRCDTRGA